MWNLPLVEGDRYLLCSDGLVDEVTDERIGDVLANLTDPQSAADHLVDMANRAGGRDNVTVVVVDIVDVAPVPLVGRHPGTRPRHPSQKLPPKRSPSSTRPTAGSPRPSRHLPTYPTPSKRTPAVGSGSARRGERTTSRRRKTLHKILLFTAHGAVAVIAGVVLLLVLRDDGSDRRPTVPTTVVTTTTRAHHERRATPTMGVTTAPRARRATT